MSMPSPLLCLSFALVLALCAAPAAARGVYQEPAAFIHEAFGGQEVNAKILWLAEDLQSGIRNILGHDYPALRLRYWRQQESSAWVLEEIGKEQPITVGIKVHAGKIERLSVLIFRESRGDEIRHPFFTGQFKQLTLNNDLKLSGHIDGISGATLSVRATEKLARLALYLHQQVTIAP